MYPRPSAPRPHSAAAAAAPWTLDAAQQLYEAQLGILLDTAPPAYIDGGDAESAAEAAGILAPAPAPAARPISAAAAVTAVSDAQGPAEGTGGARVPVVLERKLAGLMKMQVCIYTLCAQAY